LRPPGTDAGEFVNSLDGSIDLYDEAGNLLASSNGDTTLTHVVASSGKIIVKVSGENGTSGEYSVAVTGNTPSTTPLAVTSSTITDGSYLSVAPTQVTLTFNETIDQSTVQTSDVTINGVEASSFTIVDGQTVTYFLPELTDGEQILTLASGVITALDGAGLTDFTQVFLLDRVAPMVSSTSVEEGGVVPQGPLTLDVVFDEPLFDNGAGIGVEDVTLSSTVVTSSSMETPTPPPVTRSP